MGTLFRGSAKERRRWQIVGQARMPTMNNNLGGSLLRPEAIVSADMAQRYATKS
jgi:hypothetical protein